MPGGVLSPKLFNEFLQDLKKYLNPKYGLKIGDLYLAYLLFSDDIEIAVNLQAQIELFYKYCEIWNLILGIAKTKIVIYNQIYAKHSFCFTLGENALDIVDKHKYLGLWCSNNKNIFVKNHSYLAEQARKAIFTIRNYSHPHPRVKLSIVGSLRDREVVCSASDRQGSNFESCVWRTVSSHYPQEVLLAQFSLYVHKGGLKPDSFHLFYIIIMQNSKWPSCNH